MLTIFKACLLLASLNTVSQKNFYESKLIQTLTYPIFPNTQLELNIKNNTADFFSYASVLDPNNKFEYVMHHPKSIPDWMFIIHYFGKDNNELYHRGIHNGIPCNIIMNDSVLLHFKTVGFISADILFKVKYKVENVKHGSILHIMMDRSYNSERIKDFDITLWAFQHPTKKGIVIVVGQGHIKTNFNIKLLENHIKWHVDSVLKNFGVRLLRV